MNRKRHRRKKLHTGPMTKSQKAKSRRIGTRKVPRIEIWRAIAETERRQRERIIKGISELNIEEVRR